MSKDGVWVLKDPHDGMYTSHDGEFFCGYWTKKRSKAIRYRSRPIPYQVGGEPESSRMLIVVRLVPKKLPPAPFDGKTFAGLRAANIERAKSCKKFAKCKTWTDSDWIKALVGELGEAANLLKKVDRGDYTLDSIRPEVAKELADVVTYLDLLADCVGVDLGAATIAKFNEVSERVGSSVRLAA